MTGKKLDMPALQQLQGALLVLENRGKRPTSEVITAATDIVRDAIAVLQEPDPLKQRLAFVLIAIRQSTEVKTFNRSGKVMKLARITEPELYHWAMTQVHEMANAA